MKLWSKALEIAAVPLDIPAPPENITDPTSPSILPILLIIAGILCTVVAIILIRRSRRK